MLFLFYFILLLFWVLFNTTVSLLTKQKFTLCMPISMIGASFILYYSQMLLHTYVVGFYIIIAISIAAIPLLFLRKIFIKSLLYSGVIVFLCIFVLFFIIDYKSSFHIFDEYGHWGIVVKEAIRLDRFYSVPESILWHHKDYPPFMCMLQLIWCKFGGGYSEMTVLHATNVFNLVLSIMPLPFLDSSKPNNRIKDMIVKTVITFFIIITLILAFDPYKISNSILVDITIPVLFAYGFYAIWRMRDRCQIINIIELVFAQSALLLTKQSGLGLILILDIYFIFVLINQKQIWMNKVKKWLTYCGVCVAPLINFLSWKLYTRHLGLGGQFSLGNIKIGDYFSAFNSSGLQHDTLKHYIQSLFTTNITTSSWLPLSYVASSLLIALGIIFVFWLGKGYFTKKQMVSIGVSFAIGTIGYAIMMSVLYLFSFNEVEMNNLASFTRYMSSYILGEILILSFLIIECLAYRYQEKVTNLKLFVCMLIGLLLINPGNIYNMIPMRIHGNSQYAISEDAEFIAQKTSPDSKIFIIYDENNVHFGWYGAYNICAQYYLNDRFISRDNVDSFTYSEEDLRELVSPKLRENDYIFIKDTNESINALLQEHIIDGEKIKPYSVYSIVNDQSEDYQLRKVE